MLASLRIPFTIIIFSLGGCDGRPANDNAYRSIIPIGANQRLELYGDVSNVAKASRAYAFSEAKGNDNASVALAQALPIFLLNNVHYRSLTEPALPAESPTPLRIISLPSFENIFNQHFVIKSILVTYSNLRIIKDSSTDHEQKLSLILSSQTIINNKTYATVMAIPRVHKKNENISQIGFELYDGGIPSGNSNISCRLAIYRDRGDALRSQTQNILKQLEGQGQESLSIQMPTTSLSSLQPIVPPYLPFVEWFIDFGIWGWGIFTKDETIVDFNSFHFTLEPSFLFKSGENSTATKVEFLDDSGNAIVPSVTSGDDMITWISSNCRRMKFSDDVCKGINSDTVSGEITIDILFSDAPPPQAAGQVHP